MFPNYKSYPRLVGETGGKDFVVAHPSADAKQLQQLFQEEHLNTRARNVRLPPERIFHNHIWKDVKQYLQADIESFKMGDVDDFRNFINAVIDEKSFDKITAYIANAKKDKNANVIIGGKSDKSKGYFIEPTVIQAKDPTYKTMCEEIFGPVLSVYVYEDKKFEEILDIVDKLHRMHLPEPFLQPTGMLYN